MKEFITMRTCTILLITALVVAIAVAVMITERTRLVVCSGPWVQDVRAMHRRLHSLGYDDDVLDAAAPGLRKDIDDLMCLASFCP